VGPAVTRNRVRRRLREVARVAADQGSLTPGAYLVIVDPAAAGLPFATLREHWSHAVRQINSGG
jgi:ribonuclease P protein component